MLFGTPGEGFGKNGEGYFRLTSFGDREKTLSKQLEELRNYYLSNFNFSYFMM